jgi:hypothetical protein
MVGDGTRLAFSSSLIVQEVSAKNGATIANPSPATFSKGVALGGGTLAWPNGTGVYTAGWGQSPATQQATFPAGYSLQSLAINASGTIAFLLLQSNKTPFPTYLYSCALSSQACTALNQGTAISTNATSSGLQVSANYAFWYTSGANTLNSYAFATGAIEAVSFGSPTIALDASNIYWSYNSTVHRAPQGSLASHQPVATTSSLIGSIAVDGTYVYIGTDGGQSTMGGVYYAPIGGGTPTRLWSSTYTNTAEAALVAAGGALYWVDELSCSGFNVMGIATP